MITTDIGKWADYLATAARRNEAVSPITDVEPTLTVEDAYAIQDAIIERRLASGERLVGAKVGLTSRAKQQEMGINEPVYGWLTDAMALEADSSLRLSTLIHPRVEPEIVFILGKALAGPGVGIHDVLDATSAICCGLEVLDSRFIDFRFRLPHRRFHRQQGIYSGSHFAPDGRLLDRAGWEQLKHQWLPSEADQTYVETLMQPVHEAGKIASWIAPPSKGVNGQTFEFEYVRL